MVRRQIVKLALVIGLTLLFRSLFPVTVWAADQFRIRHEPTGKILGPFAFTSGCEVALGKTVFVLTDPSEDQQTFKLKHVKTDKVLGPFEYKNNSAFKIGKTPLTLLLETEIAPAPVLAGRDSGYPGIPEFVLLKSGSPAIREQIAEATRTAGTKGLWDTHLAALDKSLIKLTETSSVFQQAQRYEDVMKNPVAAMILAQAAMIRLITPDVMKNIAGSSEMRPFLSWLLANTRAMESLLASIKPKDDSAKVMSLWASLWEKENTGNREKYAPLALACALVFDGGVTATPKFCKGQEIYMDERYAYFRDLNEKRRLKTSLDSLPAWELVWVVDARVPHSELDWARKRVHLARNKWGKAYMMVKYAMDKVSDRESFHDEYTLEEILKKGGVCGDRAHFAAISAKAYGIPAMTISGSGDRGGHAWFGYKTSEKEWDIEAGRFTSDNYCAGTTRDPQTHKLLNEHEIKLLADYQRRAPQFQKSNRLTWLSKAFLANEEIDRAFLAAELAVKESSRHCEGWITYFDSLKRANIPMARCETIFSTMRTAFKDFPDMQIMANDIEIEMLIAAGAVQKVKKALKKHASRLKHLSKDRVDLYSDVIMKQAYLYKEIDDMEGAFRIFRQGFKDVGKQLEPFKTLTRAYSKFGKENNVQEQAINDICKMYRKYHSLPDTSDVFAVRAHVRLLDVMIKVLEEAGEESKADKLRIQREKHEELASKLLKTNR